MGSKNCPKVGVHCQGEKVRCSQNKELERQVFDSISGSDYSEAFENEYSRLYSQIFRGLPRKGMRLLDIGCGTGTNSQRLAGFGFSVTGIDISEKAIEKAKARARKQGHNARFFQMDAEATGFGDCSFDIVFCGAVLHHFPCLDRISREIYRITKPGGRVVSYDPNAMHPYGIFVHNFLNRFVRMKYFSPNERALGVGDLKIPFSRAGFFRFRFWTAMLHTSKKGLLKRAVRNFVYSLSEWMLPGLRKRPFLVMVCEKR